jgi:arylsulfatase A-like enzyme
MRVFFLLGVIILLYPSCNSLEVVRPNIIWLTTEDNSSHHMRLYNENGVIMPAIEKLASEGIVFDNAFSNAPVCSVARSTLITGCYAPRIFTQFHRRAKHVPLPNDLMPMPYYLKKAGYYTTNNSKQDYNFILPDEVWDESSTKATYKNRKPGQPFFHVQNHTVTHEGNLHFSQEIIDKTSDKDLEDIKVFPYHPDTKTFRFSYYHFQNRHKLADQQMGGFLCELNEQGLMEDTIIFYYGDHGGVLPRSKGYAYESGLQIPLVVYVPKKWQHLFPNERGSRSQTFVEFVDLAPTVLALAGIKPPMGMDGTPVMGKGLQKSQINKKNTAFGYADRFDEKYDLVRTLRVGKFKYIRNYQPFNMDALFNFYRYKMLAYKEWLSLYRDGKLNDIQSQFFQPKSPEALYNINLDPHEVNDLSKSEDHKEILLQMRGQLQERISSMPDLSFYPEPYLLDNALENPTAFGQNNKAAIAELIAIADLNLAPFEQVKVKIKAALSDKNPWKRYWGLIVCSSFGTKAKGLVLLIQSILKNDKENLVRIRAAEYLMLNKISFDKKILKNLLENADSETEANLMLNTLSLIKEYDPNIKFNFSKEIFPTQWYDKPNDLVNRRSELLIN